MNTVTLTREEYEQLYWEELESSNLRRIAGPMSIEGALDGLLYVEFAGGRVYRYREVPYEVLDALLDSDSPGSYLNAEIKPVYECERVQVSG